MAAGNATIGALRVELGLNSAQFETGLRRAQDSLGGFGKAAVVGAAAIGAALGAAAVGFGVAAKGAIDHADALSKLAQKSGVTVESLSRLQYAADFSDVSLRQLGDGLQKLGRNMSDVASGGGQQAKAAFDALGISITDASGKMRAPDQVFADIADRFSRLEDGATKTSLAIRLFGRAGADLIPLLNSGKTGLKQMADESDRFGNTVSTKAATGAEAFNDKLTQLGKRMEGVVNKAVGESGLIETLNHIADTLNSPEMQRGIQSFANTVAAALGLIAKLGDAAASAIKSAMQQLDMSRPQIERPFSYQNPNSIPGLASGPADNVPVRIFGMGDTPAGNSAASSGPASPTMAAAAGAGKSWGDLFSLDSKKVQDALDAVDKSVDKTGDSIGGLQEGFAAMSEAAAEAAQRMNDAFQGTVSYASDALSSLASAVEAYAPQQFGVIKALQTASAVVAGIGAAVNAWQKGMELGGLPLAGLWAGLSVAATGAQIAALNATSMSSTSMPGMSGTAVPSVSQTPVTASGPVINLELKGSGFSPRDIQNLIGQLNGALSNGAKLQVQ